MISILLEMTSVGELVKDPEWQKLRKELLGTWKGDSSEGLRKLKDYLGPVKSAPIEKLLIVRNYLDALSRGGLSNPDLAAFRKEINEEIRSRR